MGIAGISVGMMKWPASVVVVVIIIIVITTNKVYTKHENSRKS